jgi:DNA-binding GntR family transcriptional regulator
MLKNAASPSKIQAAKRPAHQSVYEQLRDRILFGELAPGQAVTIQGLADEMGAGITPVREAIRRLISTGALKMLGNRRVIVPEMTEKDIEQVDFMRKSIEPNLAGRAIPFVDEALLNTLATYDDALNTAIERGDINAYLMQNYRFHDALYTAADAPILKATVDRLWLRFGPSLRVVCGRYGTLNLPDKHADLLNALATRDRSAAEKAITEDVEQGMSQIREAMTTRP